MDRNIGNGNKPFHEFGVEQDTSKLLEASITQQNENKTNNLFLGSIAPNLVHKIVRKSYPCSKCNMKFSCEVDLNKHYCFAEPRQISQFKCVNCNTLFLNSELLLAHTRVCLKVNQVISIPENTNIIELNQSLKEKDLIKPSIEQQRVKNVRQLLDCAYCPKKFANEDDLNIHLLYHPLPLIIPEEWPNNIVETIVNTNESHNTSNASTSTEQNSLQEHICNLCNLKFKTKNMLLKHVKIHCKKFKCSLCNIGFKYKRHYQRHYLQIHDILLIPCKFCNLTFTDYRKLENHVIIEHNSKDKIKEPIKNNKKDYTCNICHKDFMSSPSLKIHMDAFHNKEIEIKIDTNNTCKNCNTKFTCRSEYDKHIKNLQQIKCIFCKQQFCSSYEFSKHKKIHLNLNNKYSCIKCEKSYENYAQIKNHIDVCNLKMKMSSFTCYFCYKILKTKTWLASHIKKHLKWIHKEEKIECEKSCLNTESIPMEIEESSNNQTQLEQTMREITMPLTQTMGTPLGNSELSIALLENEKKPNTTENGYKLPVIPPTNVPPKAMYPVNLPSTSTGSNIKTETITLYSENNDVYHVSSTQYYAEQQMDFETLNCSEVNKFICVNCRVQFYTESSYLEHIKPKIEPNNLNLPCLYCKYICVDRKELDEHIKNFHKACKLCNKFFKSQEELTKHDNYHDISLLDCYKCTCPKQFNNFQSYEQHVLKYHIDSKELTKNLYNLKILNNKLSYKDFYYCHSNTDNCYDNCPYCNKRCFNEMDFMKHKIINHNIYRCTRCRYHFRNDKNNMRISERLALKHQCIPCQMSQNKSLSTGLVPSQSGKSLAHEILFENINNLPINYNTIKEFQCKHCNDKFTDEILYLLHISPSIEHYNLNLICLFCNKILCNRKNLDEHIINVHQACKLCNVPFLHGQSLKLHYYKSHYNNINAKFTYKDVISCNSFVKHCCPYCNNSFNINNKMKLRNHKKMVHGINICDTCSNHYKENKNVALFPNMCSKCQNIYILKNKVSKFRTDGTTRK